jgi:hypothetical protein
MYGTGSGQHWLLGIGAETPLNSISPCFLTANAARGLWDWYNRPHTGGCRLRAGRSYQERRGRRCRKLACAAICSPPAPALIPAARSPGGMDDPICRRNQGWMRRFVHWPAQPLAPLFAPKLGSSPLPRILSMEGNPAACAWLATRCGRRESEKRISQSTRSEGCCERIACPSHPGRPLTELRNIGTQELKIHYFAPMRWKVSGPRLPPSDKTEMGPLAEEHPPRIRAPTRRSARPSLTRSPIREISVTTFVTATCRSKGSTLLAL